MEIQKDKIEVRAYMLDKPLETRASSEEGKMPTITGHAAVFGVWSPDLGGFVERINEGAFTETLKTDDIRSVWNHNADLVLGRNIPETLKLWEDRKGLAIEINPPSWASPQIETIERGDVDQMSFMFRVIDDEWEFKTEDGIRKAYRTLMKVKLFEVSPATFAAFPTTDVGVHEMRALERIAGEGLGYEVRSAMEILEDGIRRYFGPTTRVDLMRRELELG